MKGTKARIERFPRYLLILLIAQGPFAALNAFTYSDGASTVVRLVLAGAIFAFGVTGLFVQYRSKSAAQTTTWALEYWSGAYPWGNAEVLDRLTRSQSGEDQRAARAIEDLKSMAYEWMVESAPVDWRSVEAKEDLRNRATRGFTWCDDAVFARLWTWISWLGWHDGY